jgi:Skp family chaperone for outer membrane proteins
MKIRAAMVSGCLLFAVVLFMGYEYSWAEVKADIPGLKIGVVSIQRIFMNCKRNAKYEEETKAEQNKLNAELEKLGAELKAEEAGLKTLKPGSSDYMALVKEILTKRAGLQAQQEFYKRQMELKYQQWIEGLYEDILRETSEVAEQKGLDLVQVKDEIEFPASSVNDAMMAIRTHKLLYSGGCLDITEEVMARIDKEK